MNISKKSHSLFMALASLFMLGSTTVAAATISQVPAQLPLFVNNAVPPLNMLVVGRDHKLFFPAYNDASDLDGGGSIDIGYKPAIDYLGYFDSYKCYTYGSGYFSPTSTTTTADKKKCGGSLGWSGDYLNYLTTSRADALRKVLYGGYRFVDTTSQTILSRAYISTDAHTWGKEYKSLVKDGYNPGYSLSDYTPLPNPSAGNYTLFANNSQSTDESKNPPLLRVLSNVTNLRIFGWVSRESTQGGTQATDTSFKDVDVTKSIADYTVRVEVCKTNYREANCKRYPNGTYKPTGILHDYGEGNQMYFGLMTGTYTNNLQGGALRKAMGSFATEIDPNTGIFGTSSTSSSGTTYTKGNIIGTLDGLKLSAPGCSSSNPQSNTQCSNWGNPLAEMMFETMRYFSGAPKPTPSYISGSADAGLNAGPTAWTNPYSSTPDANATTPTYPSCSKPFETLFSDVNPNYDSDLPGSSFTTTASPSATTALTSFDATALGGTIWNNDVGGSKKINIGEVLTTNDNAPTAKTANSFGTIRGLPEEPTKQGTYDAAAVAYYANTHPITTLGNQKVQTFSIALSSTLPKIQMPVSGGTITLLPFGKVTNGVTEQITGFYVESLYNMAGQLSDANVNGGRAQAIFRVVFDDCGQGCDYDMDAIVLYTVAVNVAGTLDVTLQTVYAKAGNESHMGYTIAGTTHDGIYLEVTGGGSGNTHYALDTPGTQLPGSCPCTANSTLLPGRSDSTTIVNGSDKHTRNFTASSTTSITNLQNPLWYAAKWGGFGDSSNTSTSLPVTGQWDSNAAGTPNNYFLVTNASTLKDQLSKAFNQILQKNSSVAAPAVSSSLSTSNANATYVNSMNVAYWSGDLTKATIVTSTVGTTTTTSTTTNWVASQHMPVWSSRKIKTANSNSTSLQDFTYSNLASLTYTGTPLTSDQVDFLRGDTSKETSTFRKRASLIGDIVNSGPVLVSTALYVPSIAEKLGGKAGQYLKFKSDQASRRGQVYVGANDGMLHGFDANTGVEKFAFIPTAVISNLSALSAKTYNTDSSLHKFYVDGRSVTSDVYFGGAWHTILVGTLGAGGREIFALDVTNPDDVTLLWEFTSQTDVDLGYSFAVPVITRLHSGDWGVIVGNGYGGNNGNSTLFILNAATGSVIKKLATLTDSNSGLSSAVVLDSDSDGIADYAYAGDLSGNVWRFDLSSTSADNFQVSFGKKPLYSATVSDTPGSAVQSITAPPVVVRHPTSANDILVIFGTGRYFTTADKSSTDLQTLYGIWDKPASNTAPTTPLARSNLQPQSITSQVNNATFGSTTQAIRLISNTTVDWANKKGWYLDLSVGTSRLGERMVDPMVISSGALFVSTRTPSTDACTPGITGWSYGLDPATGGRTSFNVFTDADKYNDNIVSASSTTAGGFVVKRDRLSTPDGETIKVHSVNANGRQTWRVIPSP